MKLTASMDTIIKELHDAKGIRFYSDCDTARIGLLCMTVLLRLRKI